MKYNRRKFIQGITAAAATIPLGQTFASIPALHQENRFPVSFFTKPLDSFGFEFIAETLAQAGIDGLDPTVRPKGVIEPEKVADDLPRLKETGEKSGLLTEMMVTAITKADDPLTGKVLETASRLGVKHYRTGYYDFDFKKGIIASLSGIGRDISELAELNKELKIQGGYQNHAGIRFGGPMWDLWEVVKNIPPEQLGCQFDVCHAVTEGASSWIISMHLLSKHTGSLAIKDFTWDVSGGKARIVRVPLGEGIVDFDLYFKTIRELNIVAPITLHVEYPLLSPEEENLSLMQKQRIIVAKIRKDVEFIRAKLLKHQLIQQ